MKNWTYTTDKQGYYRFAKRVAPKTIIELARKIVEEKHLRRGKICGPTDAERHICTALADYDREVFACLFLDNRHRILAFEKLFYGTIDGTSVYPREVVKRALALNAAAVILAHNHPSGVAEPSNADERITRRIKSALELIDTRLLDHIVVGGTQTVSLAERGLV